MSKRRIIIISIVIYIFFFEVLGNIVKHFKIGLGYEIFSAIALSILWLITMNMMLNRYVVGNLFDNNDVQVNFHKIEDVRDQVIKFAVIVTKFNENWIFVRHKERDTWEIPGGKRETDEDIIKTAERELVEETGAKKYNILPVCIYSVTHNSKTSYGLLSYSEIFEFENTLTMEIEEVKEFEVIPELLTYPLIQPELLRKVLEYLEEDGIKSKSFT